MFSTECRTRLQYGTLASKASIPCKRSPPSGKAYKQWHCFSKYTSNLAHPQDIRRSIAVWKRYKQAVICKVRQQQSPDDETTSNSVYCPVYQSLEGALSRETFSDMAKIGVPSSIAVFYAVHGGQSWPHGGSGGDANGVSSLDPDREFEFFGCAPYTCKLNGWNTQQHLPHSLRRRKETQYSMRRNSSKRLGCTKGLFRVTNKSYYSLVIPFNKHTAELLKVQTFDRSSSGWRDHHIVGTEGLLCYVEDFVSRLEQEVFLPNKLHRRFQGFCLVPGSGPNTSCVTERGIQVRTSLRCISTSTATLDEIALKISIQMLHDHRYRLVRLSLEHSRGDEGHTGQPVNIQLESHIALSAYTKSGSDLVFHICGLKNSVFDSGTASLTGSITFIPGTLASPTGHEFQFSIGEVFLKRSLPLY